MDYHVESDRPKHTITILDGDMPKTVAASSVEHAPPGFNEFVADVRKRLEPFGVEVRFEIESPIAKVAAGIKCGGTVIQANRPAWLASIRNSCDRKMVVAALCRDIIGEIMDNIANAVRLPAGSAEASADRTPKNMDFKPGTRFNGVKATWTEQHLEVPPIVLEAKTRPCPICTGKAFAVCFACGRDGRPNEDDCEPTIITHEEPK